MNGRTYASCHTRCDFVVADISLAQLCFVGETTNV